MTDLRELFSFLVGNIFETSRSHVFVYYCLNNKIQAMKAL